jgi:hypothetical protein
LRHRRREAGSGERSASQAARRVHFTPSAPDLQAAASWPAPKRRAAPRRQRSTMCLCIRVLPKIVVARRLQRECMPARPPATHGIRQC